MEEGRAQESIPVVSASICKAESPLDDGAMVSVVAMEHNSSIPTAIALETRTPHQEDMQRPDLLSATVCKGPQDENGLLLVNTNGTVAVAGLEQDGMFKAAPFEIGDRVMSVNHVSCEGMDADGVAKLIQRAQKIVTVVVRAANGRADLVASMVRKDRAETRVGVTMIDHGRKVVIARIAEDGLFAHTLLNVGDTCLSINGITISPDIDAKAAAALIQTSLASVIIKAKTKRETGVVVAASKESSEKCSACIFFFLLLFLTFVTVAIVRQVALRKQK
jgi:C-terminal processing protease CtpA/Prc